MSRILWAAVALLTFAATAAGWAGQAHAAPIPGLTEGQTIQMRLALAGDVGRSETELLATAAEACATLRAQPDTTGRDAALEQLAARRYSEGFSRGYALGVMLAVTCPDTVPAATGHTVTVAPGTLPLQPVASPMEDTAALQSFGAQFSAASAVGGFGGTVVGAIIGCVIGGVVTAPTVVFVPAGCITGAVPGAGIGGILGTIAVGGPALLVAGSDLIATLTAAPGTTKWARPAS
ncbi:hypothetical protein [Nocardia thraciensis]